jgi:hypothetical protein
MSTAANVTNERHELEKGIILNIKHMNQQSQDGDPLTMHVFTVWYIYPFINLLSWFQVETKILVELSFTLDFTGSEDIVIENSEGLVIETSV